MEDQTVDRKLPPETGRNLTHIDLFSGIGGFTLACEWNGIRTEVFCENDRRCQDFLRRTYPGIPIIGDIRDFDGTKWTDRFILTAGVPCQPASRAGKQRGKGDDRWLWPETLRVISEARPDWVLCENPTGINDVGLGGILAEMEAIGYEIAPLFIIPACAVGSPQLRNRYWIVGHSTKQRSEGSEPTRRGSEWMLHLSADTAEQGYEGTRPERGEEAGCELSAECGEGDMAHTAAVGCRQGTDHEGSERDEIGGSKSGKHNELWSNFVWLPCADGKIRRSPDDSFGVAHGLHRSVLAALGNSIVPQVASEIIRAIKESSNGNNK